MTKHCYFLILTLFFGSTTAALANSPRIVVTIKPLHSLVAGITQDVTEPKLLMSSNQSPHHYSLRPSERQMLAKADLIFWLGASMESFMPRILNSVENKTQAISLIQTPGLKLLNTRQAQHHHNENAKVDAHIWLNTHNVEVLIDAITQHIIRIDPGHQQQYKTNNKKLHQKIIQLRKTLQQSLNPIKKSFLTYHDGFQYFEDEFNLPNAGFITSSELQVSAQRINQLKKQIKEKNIGCVFYDAPTKPPVLRSLLTGSHARTYMLDPVGILLPPSKNLWFDIMHSLNKQFINCQQDL